MPRRVVAVIAAAGQGTRLGAGKPKAFVELHGRTLLERSVAAIAASGAVDEIIAVVSPDMEAHASGLLIDAPLPVGFVHGRGERADSVYAGLQAITDTDAIVIVHDAARALTPPEMIARVVKAVHEGAEAVIPVVPVADTIKRVDKQKKVIDTPDRATLRAVQTPQAFLLERLVEVNRAYFAQPQPDFVATDDASLMEWAGVPVTCVDGDEMAFKITTALDFALAQVLGE